MMNSNKQIREEEDDFFGSDSEVTNNGKIDYLSNKDSDRSVQKIAPIGYSDGLEIGKEITLQRGFNEGFKQASEISYKWSLLLGLVSSVDVFFHHNKQFSNGLDTSILGNLVDKINKVIKDHCCSPTIDQLKQEFINFKDDTVETIQKDLEQVTIVQCNPTDCSKDDCCKKSEKEQKDNSGGGGCCGGNGNCNEFKKEDEKEVKEDCHDDSDSDDGCCGGSGNNEGSCCKDTTTTTTTATTATKKTEEFQFIIEKMGGQLFEDLSKECVETISSFGLDGEKMLNDCLSKKFRVTIN